MKLHRCICSLFLILQLLLPQETAFARDSSFRQVQLKYGISLEIPTHWSALAQDQRKNIKAAGEAIAENTGIERTEGRKENLLIVRATPDPTGAIIRLSTISPPDFTQSDLASLTSDDMKSLGSEMQANLKKTEINGGPRVIEMQSVRVEKLQNHYVLVIPYIRAGNPGPSSWQVTQYKIPTAGRLIELTLSYRQADASVWKPIMDKVKGSIRFR